MIVAQGNPPVQAGAGGHSAKPRRRIELVLTLGADSWEDAADALFNLAQEIERGRLRGRAVTGGYSSGHTFESSEDETVTHDSYFAALDEYLSADVGSADAQ
jgi:hypothetical protein